MVIGIGTSGSVSSEALLVDLARWKRLGVAALPGPLGQKGPRVGDWPTLPHAACWALTEKANRRGPINLVVRTGTAAAV